MEATQFKHDSLLEIHRYAMEARALQQAQVCGSDNADSSQIVETDNRLQETLEMMQERVHQQRAELEKLRSSLPSDITLPTQPSEDPRERLQQLQSIRTAYEILTPASPNAVTLQPPGSIFPTILALRTVQQTVKNTRIALQRTRKEIVEAEQELSHEKALLQDAKEFDTTLKGRIRRISNAVGSRHNSDGGIDRQEQERVRNNLFMALDAQEKQVVVIRQGTEYLKKAISTFVWKRLAPVLAEEELGGALAGQEHNNGSENDTENDNNDNNTAKLSRKQKLQDSKGSQERIYHPRNHAAHERDKSPPSGSPEALLAEEKIAQEMEQLINDLVIALRSEDMELYITLERDSPQARYLVGAKVAQFDPKDNSRLRLVDFGESLESS